MVIVIVVIGLIVGMALMSLDSLIPTSRLKQQSRKTADIIELAFSQAAIEGKDLALYFFTEERRISLEYYFSTPEEMEFFLEERMRFSTPDDEENAESDEIEPLYTSEWDDRIELSQLEIETYNPDDEHRDFIIFSPQGSCDAAEFTWRELSGLTQKLEVWPLMGKVTIHPIDFANAY